MKDAVLALARFGRALRAHGVPVSLRDEADAAEALTLVDLQDEQETRTALGIALKVPRWAFDVFDRLFGVFWRGEAPPSPPAQRRVVEAPAAPRGRRLAWDPDARRLETPGGSTASPEGEEPGASPEALLRRKAFDRADWSARDLATMERLLARLAKRLATRRSRRLVPVRGRGLPDPRASYRRALATEGELLRLARRARKVEKPRLVVLCDTSGSMDAHGRFLLSFVLSLRRAVPRCEVFAFNTGLVHLTDARTRALAPGKVALTLERLAAAVPDWSGGTRIGESLAAFADDHLVRLVDAKTTVVVLSDGLDRGDPALVAESVRRIQRRAGKLVWLNPLAGDPRYEPAAQGMWAALPYVDHFAAAHDLESLERLLPHLKG